MNKEEIAERILETYEEKIFELTPAHISHFFSRVARSNPTEKYNEILAKNFLVTKTHALLKANPPKKEADPKTPRAILRNNLYKKYPKIKELDETLNDLFFIKSHGLHTSTFKKYFDNNLEKAKKTNLKNLFLKNEVIKFDASFTVNTITYLKYLTDEDHTKKLYEITQDLIPEMIQDDTLYKSLIYILTHIIIADSKYYQRFITTNQHDWILRYFNENIDKIIEKTNTDITSEVGLCFKLCKKNPENSKNTIQKVNNHIIKEFDYKKGYVSSQKDINEAEHTNSIAFLLFTITDKLYPGPDYSKTNFIKQFNKKFL